MDVDSSSKSGPSTMVPIAIGLAGVLFGAIALFMSISNGSSTDKRINALNDQIADITTKSTQAVSGVQDLEGKTKLNTDSIAGINSQVRDFITQASGVITNMGKDIADLKAKGPSKAASSTKGASSSEASNGGPGGTHTIAAGDNFSKIASKYGVSLAALEAANPGVDSTKLKPGQKINLPGKASSSAPAPTAAPAAPAASAP